jgi:hypothetical protein
MFEPISLSLDELADRWGRTQRQILEAALFHDFPLYFAFDGLVFDVGDTWLRFNGDWELSGKIQELRRDIEAGERSLQRNLSYRRGQLKLTEWEQELTDEEIASTRLSIDSNSTKLSQNLERLAQRSVSRGRCHRNGHLRAAPSTIQGVMERGSDEFPRFAYRPDHPVRRRQSPNGKGMILDGSLVAIEEAEHQKDTIVVGDLCALMVDVKAIEAIRAEPALVSPASGAEKSEPPPAGASEPAWLLKKPQRFQGYNRPLYDVLKTAHAAGQPCPKARDILNAFRQNKPPEVINVLHDKFEYYTGTGDSKAAELGAIQKAINRLTEQDTDSPD